MGIGGALQGHTLLDRYVQVQINESVKVSPKPKGKVIDDYVGVLYSLRLLTSASHCLLAYTHSVCVSLLLSISLSISLALSLSLSLSLPFSLSSHHTPMIRTPLTKWQ